MPGKKQTKDRNKVSDEWRDKPVEQEADKDIKEGRLAGARRELQKPDRK